MACIHCSQIKAGKIVTPVDLTETIRLCRSLLEQGVIKQSSYWPPGTLRCSFEDFTVLREAGPWEDIIQCYFECPCCRQLFLLHADTYHGAGSFERAERIESRVPENEPKMEFPSRKLNRMVPYDAPISEESAQDSHDSNQKGNVEKLLWKILICFCIGSAPAYGLIDYAHFVTDNGVFDYSFKYIALPAFVLCLFIVARAARKRPASSFKRIFVVAALSPMLAALITFISAGYFSYANMLIGKQEKVELQGTVIERSLSRGRRGGIYYSIYIYVKGKGDMSLNVSETEYQTLKISDTYNGTWTRGSLGVIYRVMIGPKPPEPELEIQVPVLKPEIVEGHDNSPPEPKVIPQPGPRYIPTPRHDVIPNPGPRHYPQPRNTR